jgi:hypothetical protein
MHDIDRPQLERPEEELDRFIGPGPRGQAGRSPAARFAAAIKHLGFLPTYHFVQRLMERGTERGIRWDPRTFPSEFANGRHFRQTREGKNSRIAIVRGVPIVYRTGGRTGNRVVLITALPPDDKLPPVAPARPPVQREAFEYETRGVWDYRTAPPGPPMSEVLARAARANRELKAAQIEYTQADAAMLDAIRAMGGTQTSFKDIDPRVRDRLVAARARLQAARAAYDQARDELVRAQQRARERRVGSVRQRVAARRR